ncbi:MAG: carboxypeptidase regulatory-like domain-containing protein [Sphingobacteriales bacterium]|nr:carboxypeptidase regulatory-like domain-containing protein [Sphingobacteriales bacterium]MBI3717479.1 carboxypeptidase regulatory-like domain-containing protein [Sphingobacteriales bacterium]
MSRHKLIAALVVTLGFAFKADATDNSKKMSSGESCVNGVVIDSKTKKPLSGVVVSAMAAKMQSEKEVNSNTQGGFKIESVPVTDLYITFEKKGYKTVKKEAAKLKEGELMKLVIELVPLVDDGDDDEGMGSPLHPIIGSGFGGGGDK